MFDYIQNFSLSPQAFSGLMAIRCLAFFIKIVVNIYFHILFLGEGIVLTVVVIYILNESVIFGILCNCASALQNKVRHNTCTGAAHSLCL